MTSIDFYIDGVACSAQPGETVLDCHATWAEARRASGESVSPIPTLCSHRSLAPDGACRLCVVEVDGRRLESACTLKPTPGMQVQTRSSKVDASRRHTIGFLLRRAPESESLNALAREYGATVPMVACDADDDRADSENMSVHDAGGCILCGLCVRACARYGSEALQFVFKGQDREVRHIAFGSCKDCGLCEKLCPTGAIERVLLDSRLDASGMQAVESREE